MQADLISGPPSEQTREGSGSPPHICRIDQATCSDVRSREGKGPMKLVASSTITRTLLSPVSALFRGCTDKKSTWKR
eukprot:5727310-Amphidinium_carterae.1